VEPPEPDPSSSAWVVAESKPEPRPRPRWHRWAWLGVSAAAALGACAVCYFAVARVPMGGSADIPLPDNTRFGFRGMAGAERWRCDDGHDHYSIPYWSGIAGLGAVALFAWVRAGRARETRAA